MHGRLVKHKEPDAVRMCLFKDLDYFVNLRKELLMVPPQVAADTWINEVVLSLLLACDSRT
jgi:hypothetical protein